MTNKIELSFEAGFVSVSSEVPALGTYQCIDENPLASFVDHRLIQQGIAANACYAEVNQSGPILVARFRSDTELSNETLNQLVSDTAGQLMDGIGESGLSFRNGQSEIVLAIADDSPRSVRQSTADKDDTILPTMAMAAFHGERESILNASSEMRLSINIPFDGLLALNLSLSDKELTSYLLHEGANPNQKDALGYSSLHYLVVMVDESEDYKCEIFTMLQAHGGSVSLLDNSGKTPGQLAESQGQRRLAEMLILVMSKTKAGNAGQDKQKKE